MVYALWLLLPAILCSALHIPIYHEKAPDLRHRGIDAHHQRGWNHVGRVHPGNHGKSPIKPIKRKREANKGIDEKLDDININVINVVNGLTDLLKDILNSKKDGSKVQDKTSSNEALVTKIMSNPIPYLKLANVAQVPVDIENIKTTAKSQNSSILNIKASVDVPAFSGNNKLKLPNQIGKVNAATSKVANVKDDLNKAPLQNANASPVRTKRFSDFKAFIKHDIIKEAVVDGIQHHESGVVKRQIGKPDYEVKKKHNKRHLKNPFLDTWKLKVHSPRNHEDESRRRHHLKPRVLNSNF